MSQTIHLSAPCLTSTLRLVTLMLRRILGHSPRIGLLTMRLLTLSL